MSRPLEILFEDNHLLVINKPALLATMGVSENEPSLVKLAKVYLKDKYNKPGNVYLGVVSRLDSFATGAIVLARTSKSASRLSEQIRLRKIVKTYWAIVPSEMPMDSGTLENWVFKSEAKKRMYASDEEREDSKVARLKFRTLNVVGKFRLIEIDLETGRKHQIRVQFSHLGFPIVGDRKYDSELAFSKGIALHCRSLKFQHPTKKTPVTVDANPPSCWKIERFRI